MRAKGIPSLVLLLLLCLPSTVGGAVFLLKLSTGQPVESWGVPASLMVAVAAMFGTPLILLAIALCVPIILGRKVSPGLKFADLVILGMGMAATLIVSFRPGF